MTQIIIKYAQVCVTCTRTILTYLMNRSINSLVAFIQSPSIWQYQNLQNGISSWPISLLEAITYCTFMKDTWQSWDMVRQACRCTVSWETWSVVRATELTSGQPHNTASMLTWTGCPHDICSPRTQSEPYPDAVSVTWINIKIFKDAEYIYL